VGSEMCIRDRARSFSRDTYATPAFPGDPAFAGNQTLLDRDRAIPLWDERSLRETWKEVDTPHPPLQAVPSDPLLLEVSRLTLEGGGASVEDLFQWAMGQGIAPSQFFQDVQTHLQTKKILDRAGILVSSLNESVS